MSRLWRRLFQHEPLDSVATSRRIRNLPINIQKTCAQPWRQRSQLRPLSPKATFIAFETLLLVESPVSDVFVN